jgi:hypothetical protein
MRTALFVFGMVFCAGSTAHAGTRWDVRTSQGFDALCALNVLSGDPYYLEQYPDEAKEFATPAYAPAREAAAELKRIIKDRNGGIVSAHLTLVFSGGPDSTLAAVLASAQKPERLETSLRSSPYWSEDSWNLFLAARAPLVRALEAMHRAGFESLWEKHLGHDATARADGLRKDLARYDVLGEEERLLGHELQGGRIEVILLWYSRPHGIRIQGERFLTNIGYPASVVLRNAVHEPMHPPFDKASPAVRAAIDSLSRDSLMARIVAGHNPSFGYTTIAGYVEEDAVQALEQVVSERLGVAVPAAERWRASDDGMHLLAAALYDLMKESGFAERGGVFASWFTKAVADGELAPRELARRARSVVGDEAVARWDEPVK